MNKFFLLTSIALVTVLGSLVANPTAPSLMTPQQEPELIVYNRVLARVNGKTFSVVDVMKKMDLFLQKNYPHMISSKAARFQFYASQWKEYLSQMVNQELILADAEKLEVKVTDADVREEILMRFGPNVMATLDQINLGYDEAKELIHAELVVQRMMWFRVHAKALNEVTPEDVKIAYKDYCLKNPSTTEWEYEVLSLRSSNNSIGEVLAHKACDLVKAAQGDSLEAIASRIKEEGNEGISVTVSCDLKGDEKTIAKSHREVLETLPVGGFSAPVAQVSRVDQAIVHRIFHLKNLYSKKAPIFEKKSGSLKEELINQAAMQENVKYIAKLRSKLGYDDAQILEAFPEDFQPFALR